MSECLFRDRQPDGRWVCFYCRRPSRYPTAEPPQRDCHLPILVDPPCPFEPLVRRLTPHGVARLNGRCRQSECGLLRETEEGVTCTGCGRVCEQLRVWANLLNGDQECPFWQPVS